MNNKKLIKKQYLKSINQQNFRSWAKKHQIGGVMYDLQTQQLAYGQPVPQSSTQATSPSTKPQQSPLAFMQQQASNLAQQTQNYTTTQNEKEALAQQQIEERNKKANSIGEQIGSMVGKVSMQLANNAYLKNQENKNSVSNNMSKQITETTNQNLQGAKNFNTSFVKNAASDIASLQLPKITDTSFDLNSIVQTATDEAYHS